MSTKCTKLKLLSVAEITEKYGQPGDTKNFTTIDLPYHMVLSWDHSESIKKMMCHKLVAPSFLAAFLDVHQHYGTEKIIELGINRYGGCFNHRPKRGTEAKYIAAIARKNYALAYTYLSTHSWAIAYDLDPVRNLLRETSRTARFARPEYKPMIEAFYDNNIVGLGPEKNYDWMHWQIGK